MLTRDAQIDRAAYQLAQAQLVMSSLDDADPDPPPSEEASGPWTLVGPSTPNGGVLVSTDVYFSGPEVSGAAPRCCSGASCSND